MGCLQSRVNAFAVRNVDSAGNFQFTGYLVVNADHLALYDHHQQRTHYSWHFSVIRKYGFNNDVFMFEVGRKACTGENMYLFKCPKARKLFEVAKRKMKANNEPDEPTSPRKFFLLPGTHGRRSNPYVPDAAPNFPRYRGRTKSESSSAASEPTHPLVSYQSPSSEPIIRTTKTPIDINCNNLVTGGGGGVPGYSALNKERKGDANYVNQVVCIASEALDPAPYCNLSYRAAELQTPTLTTPSTGVSDESGSIVFFPSPANNQPVVYSLLDGGVAGGYLNEPAASLVDPSGILLKQHAINYVIPDAGRTKALTDAVHDRNTWRDSFGRNCSAAAAGPKRHSRILQDS